MKKILLSLLALMVVGALVLWFGYPGVVYTQAMNLERSMADLDVAWIEVDGKGWSYLEGGAERTTENVVVMIHGFTADKDNWNRLGKYLKDDMYMVAPDLAGFGSSDPAANPDYSIGAQVDRLKAFVDTIELQRFHLMGNSMGGYIAGVFAERYPDRVISQTLLAPGGVAAAAPSKAFEDIVSGRRNQLISGTREEFEAFLDLAFEDRPYIPGPVLAVLAERHIAHHILYEGMFDDLRYRSPPLEDSLAVTRVPTLIIWGEQDRILNPDGALVLLTAAPDATLLTYQGVGHVPMLEVPEQVAEDFLSFYRGLYDIGEQTAAQ